MGIKNFVSKWSGRGFEKSETQKFWSDFLRDVFEIDEPLNFIDFEVPVKLKHTSFIDAYLPDSRVIIEQKSLDKNLLQKKSQSDGTTLTPYEQAQRYGVGLPLSMHPRKIIVCNFAEFLIYDMETLEPPIKILLEELPDKFHLLDFLIDPTKNKLRLELELSLQAGEIVARIYDALLAQYVNPSSDESLASLNKLCVRLVFCLYAESSGIFGAHKIFRDYLSREYNLRWALIHLFEVLNTPLDERDPYLDDSLKKFPYVNGGLFDGAIEILNFTPEIKTLLLEEASSGFNWNGISPTIFGAVFESTLNPETRRAGGMHYTSIENIHKVIDPLFMEDLRGEFSQIKTRKKLLEFQEKLAAIKIFDPACGSGNFLTESYLSLRRLENEVLKKLFGSQIKLGNLDNPIKVSIANFYGIEINDFAVAVAQTALWIAELQMMIETQEIIHRDLDFLPIKSHANIYKANALRVDWKEICPRADYIIGNPPFVGHQMRSAAQVEDMALVFSDYKKHGRLDYVTGWYKKADVFMQATTTRAAFLSTKSITQGEQVAPLWKNLTTHIDFARRTFKWESESKDKANVYCVIIGFSTAPNPKLKVIFDGDKKIVAENINAYLLDAPNIFIEKQATPISDVPPILKGAIPTDNGNYILSPAECAEFIKREPLAEKYIRVYIGGEDFIKGQIRYCLWLKDCPPGELHKMPLVMKRVKNVREYRLASKSPETNHYAEMPTLFFRSNFIAAPKMIIPRVTSSTRKYVPMGFVAPEVVVSSSASFIANAELYHFGVLMSSIHMLWLKTVGGYFGTSYSYGGNLVYNTFAWCKRSDKIEKTAQAILDVRARYPDSTLADLYDPLTMPRDLREVHRANDKAVARAYGFEKILDDEPKIVAELFKLYAVLTS